MPEPISAKYLKLMNDLAKKIDWIFNGTKNPEEKEVAFLLLVADFGDSKRCNYISNAARADCIVMMKEVIARFEGQPEPRPGRA